MDTDDLIGAICAQLFVVGSWLMSAGLPGDHRQGRLLLRAMEAFKEGRLMWVDDGTQLSEEALAFLRSPPSEQILPRDLAKALADLGITQMSEVVTAHPARLRSMRGIGDDGLEEITEAYPEGVIQGMPLPPDLFLPPEDF